jgi:hypothetical protein
MQTQTDAAASSTNNQSAFSPSLGFKLLDRVTPHKVESASTGRLNFSVLSGSHNAAEETQIIEPLQGSSEQSDHAWDGMTDPFREDEQSVCPIPDEFSNFESLDDMSLNMSFWEPLPDLPVYGEWNPEYILDLDTTDQSAFSNVAVLQPASTWTFEPTNLTGAEPLSPTFPPSIASVYSLRRDSISSRSCTSESPKRRIDPLKHIKSSSLRELSEYSTCELCERKFRYKKDVERHKHSIHDKKPSWFCPAVECKFATLGFSRKDKAFQHVKTHRSNSESSLKPIFAAEKTEPQSRASTPVSPRLSNYRESLH